MPRNTSNPLVELLGELAEAAKAFWRRRLSANEVARLDWQERACIARDLGLSTNDLGILAAQGENAADLLVRRMATVGLNPDNVDAAVMRDLQRCCSLCDEKVLCVHEIEDRPKTVSWPNYCPNRHTLAALNAGQLEGPNAAFGG